MGRVNDVALVFFAVVLVVLAGVGLWLSTLSFGDGPDFYVAVDSDPIQRDRIADSATANLSAREARAVDAAIANGFAEVPEDEFEVERRYAVRNGSYYRLSIEEGDGTPQSRPVVQFRPVSADGGTGRTLDSLPRADHTAVKYAAHIAASDDRPDDAESPPWEYVYRKQSDIDQSELVTGDVDRVTVRNRTFRVAVTERTVALDTKRVTANRVAGNESAFLDAVIRDPTALSLNRSAPLWDAVDAGEYSSRGGSYADAWRPIDPLASLCDVDRSAIQEGGASAVCYVRYEGMIHRLEFTSYQIVM